MSKSSPHPTREELSAYSLGQLPPDRAVAIDGHISECQPCCETIVGISSADTFVGLLKAARQLPDQTVDRTVENGAADNSSSHEEVAAQLADHPRYEVLELVGKGGMGDVYRARHRLMDRTVALKIIKPELMRKADAVDRFHREVKAAAKLTHPNIVTAFDAEQAGDVHFLVMEYVDGVDLAHVAHERGALPVAEACEFIRQAAIGLQHAHEQGMVHRDIKPHNLMVMADGTVKILDFGLASLAPNSVSEAETVAARGDLTAAGSIMGTPDFMSPEQAEDARSADIRSDIYSLGSTLYFLLSGQPPFADGSVTQKLKSHATAEPDALRTLRDDIPMELESVIARMTAKDPAERFQSPHEVAVALQAFVDDRSPGTVVATAPQQRNSAVMWLGAAALTVAVVFAWLFMFGRSDPNVDYKKPTTDVLRNEAMVRDPSTVATHSGKGIASDQPSLRISNDGAWSTHLGTVSRSWKLQGNRLSQVVVRLLHISKGKLTIASEHELGFPEDSGETTGRLAVVAEESRKDWLSVSLNVTFDDVPKDGVRTRTSPLMIPRAMLRGGATVNVDLDEHLSPRETEFVHTMVLLPAGGNWGTVTHRTDDTASMLEASKQGFEFVAITLSWDDARPQLGVGPEIAEMLEKTGQSKTEFQEKLNDALSHAAGIPNAQWEKLAKAQPAIHPAKAIEGEPLSIVLLMGAPLGGAPGELKAFRLLADRPPKPRELHDAMSLSQEHGYVSVIQPEYVKRTTIELDAAAKLLRGTVEFEAPKLYAGRVNFAVQIGAGRMKVVEFSIPGHLALALDGEGVWRRKDAKDEPDRPEPAGDKSGRPANGQQPT
ncbi:MAG: serine/threonine protein kinase [Planctomycetales bacterium]|nr:serine/threonine protein kinase [Planctomycetales bacterium]